MVMAWVKYDLNWIGDYNNLSDVAGFVAERGGVPDYLTKVGDYEVPVYFPWAQPWTAPDTPEEFIVSSSLHLGGISGYYLKVSALALGSFSVRYETPQIITYRQVYPYFSSTAVDVRLTTPKDTTPQMQIIERFDEYFGRKVTFQVLDYVWRYVKVDGPEPGLFTTGNDTVNFNALTKEQTAFIATAPELQFSGLGGNDIVNLPDKPGQGSWQHGTPFTTGTKVGDKSTVKGGTSRDNVVIGGLGDDTFAAGFRNNTFQMNGGSDTFKGEQFAFAGAQSSAIFLSKFDDYNFKARSYSEIFTSLATFGGKLEHKRGIESLTFSYLDSAVFTDKSVKLKDIEFLLFAKDLFNFAGTVAIIAGSPQGVVVTGLAQHAIDLAIAAKTESGRLLAKKIFVTVVSAPFDILLEYNVAKAPPNVRVVYELVNKFFSDVIQEVISSKFDKLFSGNIPFPKDIGSFYNDLLDSAGGVKDKFIHAVGQALGISDDSSTHFIKGDGLQTPDIVPDAVPDFSPLNSLPVPTDLRLEVASVDDRGNFNGNALFRKTYTAVEKGDGLIFGPTSVQSVATAKSLQFVDGVLSFDPDASGYQVYRLYKAVLGREPDGQGLSDWAAALSKGQSLSSIVPGFTNSPEFQGTYGSLSDEAFVTLLYKNVLGRDPDAVGLSNWLKVIVGGTGRSDVVLGFSESPEFRANIQAATPEGIWIQDREAAAIARLYHAALDRPPDAFGLTEWTKQFEGGRPLGDIADGFAFAPEFQAKYGALSSQGYVEQLYRNVLDREADAAGLAAWTAELASGHLDRGDVLLGFSESLEFQIKTQPLVDHGIHLV